MGPLLKVDGYAKFYDERVAVDGLSFEVQPGEIVGLVGPNGAGKTTTLRGVSGVIAPTHGTIEILGHNVAVDPVAAKQELALVADDPSLFESLTVQEHLEFTAQVFGLDSWESRADELLETFEISDRRKTLCDELSRGMRQKVQICCALLHAPQLILFDEPLTGLDPRGIRTLFDVIRDASSKGAGIIVSSHLLGQISDLCSRFLIIRSGSLLHSGTVAEIRAELGFDEDASLEEVFLAATETPKHGNSKESSVGASSTTTDGGEAGA